MEYRAGYKYQLAKDEMFLTRIIPDENIDTDFIRLSLGGVMRIAAGYAWDGPSGPTLDSRSAMRGSLFHDASYQLLRQELLPANYRTKIDDEFGRFLEEDGMWWWRRKLWVRELKNFGGAAADPESRKPVLTAPRTGR